MSYASEEAQMVGHLGRRMLEMAFGAQPPIKRKRNESEEESKDETAGYNVSTKPQKKPKKNLRLQMKSVLTRTHYKEKVFIIING